MKRKNVIKIFLIALIAIFSGRVAYRWFISNRLDLHHEQDDLAKLRLHKLTKMPEPLRVIKPGSYNFQKMIRLIDACSTLKIELSVGFDTKLSSKKVDRPLILSMIQELLHERAQLREYIWELKGYTRAAIPSRKYRSLLYYLEVLDHNLADMRGLLHQSHQVSPQHAQTT